MGTERVDPVFQPLAAGDPAMVSGYRIAARLGEGGMGTVYLSYTPGGRPVAIKVIRPELAGDPEFRRRFRQEVQAAQQVQGLYTAPVIDSDTDGRSPWLATAYVAGPSLHAAVTRHGPLPVPAVALTVAGIAEALQAIHSVGIVHRDLKPSNVLLASDGPRVIDFGIARAADATSLTRSGAIVGTPSFMTPEQASGAPCVPATDVFALGQVAVYAATGRPAFGEGTPHAALYRIVHEEPQLSDMPGELLELARRCLEKDPAARPAPAEIIGICRQVSPRTELRRPEGWLPPAVAADLGRHTTMPRPPRGPAVPTGRPKWRGLAVGTLIAGLAAVGVAALLVHNGTLNRAAPTGGTARPDRSASPLTVTSSGALTTAPSAAPPTMDAPATNPPTTDPPATAPTEPRSSTYRAIDLPENYIVDLAESPPQPTRSDLGPGYAGDFGYFVDRVTQNWGFSTPDHNTLALLRSDEPGSLATCLSVTRYTHQIKRDNAVKGSRICVISRAGHVALVTVRGYSPDNSDSLYATVDLQVWQNALEPTEES